MATITAELYGTATPRAVLVTVQGLTGVDRVNVYREAPSTARQLVRGGIDVTPSGDALLLVDVEAELGRPLIYVAETYTGSTVAAQVSAAPVTVPDPGRHVLSNPLTGAAVLVDLVATPDERTQEARGSVLRPRGTARPVAITDVREDDTGALQVYTRDRAETAELVTLLASALPVVSRHPYDGCDVAGVEVLYVSTATRARRSRAGDRVWELAYAVTDSPAPTVPVALVSLQDLATAYTGRTLADLAADHATLLDVARDDFGAL